MHDKINCTPLISDLGLYPDKEGVDIAVAVLKATYLFDAAGNVTEAQGEGRLPVFQSDQYYESPESSSVEYASDIAPDKIGTDVAVNGSVYGANATRVEAGFSVNGRRKEIIAWGERRMETFLYASIGKPRPFNRLPLRYEGAYGGSFEEAGGRRQTYPYNPVGLGFAPKAVEGMKLPFFEYRKNPFRNIKSRPYPAGLGFIPTHWMQRARFAGTFDQKWHDERRPLFPEDFDARFYNTVSQDQVFLPKLSGGEKISLYHLHPGAKTVTVSIPDKQYVCVMKIKGESRELPMEIDTILFEPDKSRFALTYRASSPVGADVRAINTIIYREGAGRALNGR